MFQTCLLQSKCLRLPLVALSPTCALRRRVGGGGGVGGSRGVADDGVLGADIDDDDDAALARSTDPRIGGGCRGGRGPLGGGGCAMPSRTAVGERERPSLGRDMPSNVFSAKTAWPNASHVRAHQHNCATFARACRPYE